MNIKGDKAMTNNRNQPPVKRSPKRGLALLIATLALTVCIFFCTHAVYFVGGMANDGRPIIRDGNAAIKNAPRSDVDAVNAAREILNIVSWWEGEPKLVIVNRLFDCGDVESPTKPFRLTFVRLKRVTILTSHQYGASLEIEGVNIKYRLYDKGLVNMADAEGIQMANLLIDSAEAINRVELLAGKLFRETINDECAIRIGVTGRETFWSVDYIESNGFRPLRCFDVDVQTGAVVELPEREFKPCIVLR